jgi:site-specific recombinase XerD
MISSTANEAIATLLLDPAFDIRKVQELLGHHHSDLRQAKAHVP